AGDASGTLVATYDSNKRRSTQISARALGTSLTLTPNGSVDFGPVCVGQSKSTLFTVRANDLGGFELGSISDPHAPFAVSPLQLPIALLGSGANEVQFEITASPQTAGPSTASTVVHTDIPHDADHTVDLSVLGLPPMGVTATLDTLDLGSLPINTTA